MRDLFNQQSPWCPAVQTWRTLRENHYLGPTRRGSAYADSAGVMVVAAPTGRRLPIDWLELTRWCILDRTKNAGSQQFARFVRSLRVERPEVTTIISYSDPSVGHDGALYRACNWWWAPTWHRLRPPPTGNGAWTEGERQSVKDRWVFSLQRDPRRLELLTVQDESILKRLPWAQYREPGGADFKTFRRISAGFDSAAYTSV